MFLGFSSKSLGLFARAATSVFTEHFGIIFVCGALFLAIVSVLIIILLAKSVTSAFRKRHAILLIIGLIFFLGLLAISFLVVFEDLSIIAISALSPLYELYGRISVGVLHICLIVVSALQIVMVAVKPRKQRPEPLPRPSLAPFSVRLSEPEDAADETVEVNDMFREFGDGTGDVKERIENITQSIISGSRRYSEEGGTTVDIFDGIERVLGEDQKF